MDLNHLISLKDFSILGAEFDSPSLGLATLDALLKKNNPTLFEFFPTLEGRFVALFVGDLAENIYQALQETNSHINLLLIKNANSKLLQRFYHLHTPKVGDSLAILETSNILALIELIHESTLVDLEVLDHKNSRSFLKNYIVLGGKNSLLKEFISKNKSLISDAQHLESPTPSLLSFFGMVEPL